MGWGLFCCKGQEDLLVDIFLTEHGVKFLRIGVYDIQKHVVLYMEFRSVLYHFEHQWYMKFLSSLLLMKLDYLIGQIIDISFTHRWFAHVNVLDNFNVINGLHFCDVLCDYFQSLVLERIGQKVFVVLYTYQSFSCFKLHSFVLFSLWVFVC